MVTKRWSKLLRSTVMDGRVLSFRIKRSLKMRTLMQAYSDRLKVDANTFVFLYDGVKLSPDDTPDELKLEDGAEIDAMLHQDGGFFHCAFM
ncbi:PREDICTED: small ubiquitin-related modifier 2-like [Tarenaya hassleriana]|uniref:small ubiquitin-related modifier 2-like n=1 Tax=Tarenaya hassleriana TaxID=28532 RepID=UPI00053C1D52|nr:PREDICTED: small ubiquitin-related modifier 2-like [Tarenaya hassleriana]